MKTDFIPQLQRDAYYDGGGEGERPPLYSGYTGPAYVDQRGTLEKIIDKTPTWLMTLLVMLGLVMGITLIILFVFFLNKFVSYYIMGISLVCLLFYGIIYKIVEEMRNN